MNTRRRTTNRALGAATAAILGLTTVQVVAPDSTFLPAANAATRTIPGTTVTYDDQNPASVPWSTTVKQNPSIRYGNLYLSLDAVERDGIAKTGTYDQWGSPVPLTIWDTANQTKYRKGFTSAGRPDPFSNSNNITTQLGEWTYVSQSSSFTVTWNPAPGYIGYAPPLPIQIDPTRADGQPAPQYDYATTGLPGKTTTPLTSTGALGTTQTAQAKPGFQGVTDGIVWDYLPTYAFQVDRKDPIAALATGTLNYATDADGNYVGYVTNELNTSEGRYTINPDSGEVTFTPNNDFFKTGDLTTKQATPIRVIVSNMTTNTDEGNGRVMAYGVTRPAHTIKVNNQSYSEVNTTYTPTVTKPSVQLEDVAGQNQVGRAVTLRPNYAQADGAPAINTDTVELLNPDGTTAGKTLTVENEGTWQVNSNGTVTFTPQVGFIGDPTPVKYTAKNTVGIQADPATLTVDYFVPDGRPATTFGTQGVTQKSTDRTTSEGDRGLTAQQMFPGYPTNWYSSFTYQLVDRNGNAIAPNTALKYDNVGTYTIDAASGEVTFTPDPLFTGPAPEVGVRIANLTTANGQQRGTDGSYLPVVTASNVYLQPAFANGNVGDTLKATPDYAIAGLPKIDTQSISLIDDSGKRVGTTLTVEGQGTWTVDLATGEFSFTPVAGFLGNPAPVKYTARSVDGIAAREPSTVTVTYNPLVTRTATTIGGPTDTQHSTDLNSPGDAGKTTAELFPGLPEAWFNAPVQFKLVDGTNLVDTLTVDGEGTYTIDPATGVVSFTPVDGFLGGQPSKQAGGVKIQAVNTTANGTKVNSTLIAQYIPTVEDRTYTLPSATNSAPIGQPGKATPDYGTTIDPTSVQLLDAAGNPVGKTLDIPGQGTWTVNPTTGEFTFTPVPGFVGTPVSVLYTAAATNGGTVTGTGGVTITYPAAVTVPATTVGPQGTAQNSFDKGANDTGRTPAEMFPNLPGDWYGKDNSPVKFQLVGATGNVLTVDGVGTYTLNPLEGTVKFEPEKGFTGQAPAVEIQTVGLRDASGQPAEMTSTYQPFVVPVRVEIPSDYAKATRIGQPITVTPKYLDTTVDKSTIRIIAPQGSTLSDDGKTLVVPGEGTWTVDKQGNFTFTPQGPDGEGGAFVGSPTPIDYTATNVDGIPAQVPGQISAFYPTPDPTSAVTTNLQGVTQHSDDKNRQNQGLTAKEMFPNIAQATWWDQAVFGLFAPDGTPAENNTLTVAGEGTYTINPTTGQVTFTPEPAFVGTAQSVGIGIVNAQGTPTAKYTAVVEPVDVHLYDASVLGNIGSPLKVTPRYLDTVDKSTVEFVGADGKPAGKELKVDGQGTWTVDNNGTFTFTPVDGFYGTPTPVNYTAKNANGVQSTDTGTVSGDYRSPRTSPSISTGDVNQTQTSKTGAEMFPSFPGTWTITYSLPGATDNTIETADGTFTIDPATGVVTFTPAKDFSGTPDPVTVRATTATGATETTTYQVSVTGRTTQSVLTTATQTETAAPVTVTTEVPTTVVTTVPTTVTSKVPTTVEVPTTVNGTPTTVTQTTVVPTTVVSEVPTTLTTAVPTTVTETATPVTTTVEVPTTINGTPTTVTQTQVITAAPVTVTTEVPTTVEKTTTVNGTPTTITETLAAPTTISSTTIVVADLALSDAERVVRTPGPASVTPKYSDAVKRDSVRIVSSTGQEVTTLVVPGQGTWTVHNGTFTFTPEDGFTGNPNSVSYTAYTSDGVKAHAPATITVGYDLPATETKTTTSTETTTELTTVTPPTVTERVTDVITATNPVVTTTVTAEPVTVTPPTVTVTPDPIETTVTQVREPQPVTVTAAPITIEREPVTTTITVPGKPAVTTTLTVTPEPVTATPEPVVTTIPGGTETIAVTVTPAPVTVTQDPTTVTPDPVTITQATTATTTVDNSRVEFTAGSARVDTLQGTEIKVVIQDEAVDNRTLQFRPVEGSLLSDDHRTLTIPDQGTWTIDDEGSVHFAPKDGFTGELTKVEIDYTHTDGTRPNNPYTITGSYRPATTETDTETTTTTATPTATDPKQSSGNDVVQRCFSNAVRSPILWAIPIALLGQVGGKIAEPYIGQFQSQLNQMNAQLQEEIRRNTPDFGFGRQGYRNEEYERLVQQVNAANQQLQSFVNRPEIQQLGKFGGIVLAVIAASAVLYDWCSAEPGKAFTAIDIEGGSSIDSKKNAPRYVRATTGRPSAGLTTVQGARPAEPTSR
ncbi:Ig-like domain-containing protein [Corynebacterium bouchesdurhonense]|uniref:Ig-like domain-containing protein n=1 Tax=Corynebacterium bouchesdurhonense TaxID=1720192 RepID=UPI0008331D9F|nr:hypothetical protein [Corynebacterium bouchesdurhonense]